MNLIGLAALADHIASYFSDDATIWRPDLVATPLGTPVAVRWEPARHSALVDAVVDALRLRTAAPYRSSERPDSVAIVNERVGEPAQAIIAFHEETREGDGSGLAYELTFVSARDAWPGWFAVRAL